jgi:hypothetical protein
MLMKYLRQANLRDREKDVYLAHGLQNCSFGDPNSMVHVLVRAFP